MLSPSLLLLVLCSAAAPAAPGPLEQVVAHLEQKKCDDAFLLIAQVKVPAPPTPEGRAAAGPISNGAVGCRSQDSKVALALSALAVQLAPDDPQVLLAHAEGLIGEQQRGEAAALLDRLVKAQAAVKAPDAWFLRARLASEEGDHERAVELLTLLATLAAHRDRAAPLLAEANAAVEKSKAERRALAEAARRAPPAAAVPAPARAQPKGESLARRHEPGTIVASFGAWVGLGESRVFVAQDLVPGQTYEFQALGSCRRRSQGYADVRTDVFGVDFRVQFGAEASRSLSTGQNGATDENKIPFVAEASQQSIRVFDASSAGREASCWMSGFSVTAK
ncbi:MAG TPA: hypothetical protein VGK67_13530 [Myxococcales bacterium]